MNDYDYDDVCEDDRPRYVSQVDALMTGDQVFTAAGRWETVTRLERTDPYACSTRVFTDVTGPDYAWSLPNRCELPTLRSWHVRRTPMVQVDTRHVVAFVAPTNDYAYSPDAPVLATAYWAGRGQGWDVVDAPGADPVRVATKAAAVSAVRRAARKHAKALRLRLNRPGDGVR